MTASRARLTAGLMIVLTIPLVWAVLLLFHPNPEGGPFEAVREVVDRWLVVHVGQLLLTPFLVLVVWRLLDGFDWRAAKVSRGAAVVWAVFFTAYDSIQGIATGLLIRFADRDLAGEEQAGIARALDYLVSDSRLAGNISAIGLIANAAWVTVAIGAAVCLHRAGTGRWAVIAACVSVLFVLHTAPAAVGLVALAIAGVLRERQKALSEASDSDERLRAAALSRPAETN
jgi:hypothetical protein